VRRADTSSSVAGVARARGRARLHRAVQSKHRATYGDDEAPPQISAVRLLESKGGVAPSQGVALNRLYFTATKWVGVPVSSGSGDVSFSFHQRL
jgi:hypothetical protein